jgi:hypothetical protein
MIVGGIALAWAGIWWVLTANVRRRPLFEGLAEPSSTTPEPHPPAAD